MHTEVWELRSQQNSFKKPYYGTTRWKLVWNTELKRRVQLRLTWQFMLFLPDNCC